MPQCHIGFCQSGLLLMATKGVALLVDRAIAAYVLPQCCSWAMSLPAGAAVQGLIVQ